MQAGGLQLWILIACLCTGASKHSLFALREDRQDWIDTSNLNHCAAVSYKSLVIIECLDNHPLSDKNT